MSNYTRYYFAGGYYFFTLVTGGREPLFSYPENVSYLRLALGKVKKKYPFSINAMVILPDHLHSLWKMPANDANFSLRWRLIKRYFSMEINLPVNIRKEKKVWQKRFWEHVIRDEWDWRKHMDYIHYNPVKHGLVKSPAEWEHSSFHYWVKKGLYEKTWGAGANIILPGWCE